MIDFSRIPFVRLLIPLIVGILLYNGVHCQFNSLYVLLTVFLLLSIVYLLSRKTTNLLKNTLFVILSDLFLLVSGFYGCYHYHPANYHNYYGHYVIGNNQNWIAEINELPVEKEKFYKATVTIQNFNSANAQGKALVYFKKPFNRQQLTPGTCVVVNSKFQNLKDPANPNEFNYRLFMENKNIYFQTFVDSSDVIEIKKAKSFSLINYGLELKQRIVTAFFDGDLTKEAAQLCSALLTGYDDEISTDIINSFAHSGTLHVLSVSGLHTGILFMVLMFIAGWLDPGNRFPKFKLCVVLFVLWGFVLIAGFSAPILRAAIMLSLISIGKYFFNYFNNASINILAVSAFILLLFNPLLIYDIGFLLSYSAVVGIILFEPYLTKLFYFKYGFINKIWQLCSVSIAAQISTLPFTLYFFHQFPLWFVLANLFVIPVCTLLMVFGMLYLLKLTVLSVLINVFTEFVLALVKLSNVSGIGYIDKIDFNLNDSVLLTIALILFTLFVKQRTFTLAISFLLTILVWMLFSVIQSYQAKSFSNILVYHTGGETVIDVKNKTKLFTDNKLNENAYNFHIKNNHTSYNYPNDCSTPITYIASDKSSVLVVKQESDLLLIPFFKPNILIVTNNCIPNEAVLETVMPDRVVCDGSNAMKTLNAIKKLCFGLKIPVYSTIENGFLELPL